MDLQSMGELHCDVCFELFGENLKCPRMLTCGHSFCHSCLENLVVQSPTCPNCKQEIQFTSAYDIPVNYTVKSFVSLLIIPVSQNGHNLQLNSAHSDLAKELTEDSMDSLPLKKELSSSKELPYEGYCDDHRVNKNFRCMDCKCWVCGICVALHHKPCRTVLVPEALDKMKQEIRHEFKAEIEAQKLQSKNFDKVLTDIKKKKLSIKNEIKKLQLDLKIKLKLLKSIGKDIENLQSIKSDSNKHCEKLKLMKSSVEESSNDDQFMKSKNKFNEFLIEAKKLTEELTIPRYTLCHFSLKLLRDWCHDGSVYASRCQNGSTQYGKVVVKGNRVWVHCFQPQKPNQKDVIVSFKDLLMNFSGSSKLPRRGFLQVEDDTLNLRDVVIATDAVTPRALNFLLFCSGIRGRSYEGNKFNKGECWIAANLNDGAVVKGIKDGGIYEAPEQKGFVWGEWSANTNSLASFIISMIDQPTEKFYSKLGCVVEGIDVCERIHNNGTVIFTIKHCGLVI